MASSKGVLLGAHATRSTAEHDVREIRPLIRKNKEAPPRDDVGPTGDDVQSGCHGRCMRDVMVRRGHPIDMCACACACACAVIGPTLAWLSTPHEQSTCTHE